jgi:hypothetical protein
MSADLPPPQIMRRKIAEMARQGIAIFAIQIPIEGVKKMPKEISLNDADIKVAHKMGIDLKTVARLKYQHGRGGLSGVALLGKGGFLDTGLGTGPIPPTNPGRITDKGGVPVKTVIEPENSDDELVKDPAGLMVRPMRVIFPVASE